MSTAPLRLGLAGCGRLAEAGYVPALTATPTVELVAVADPDPLRRERVAGAAAAAGLGALAMHPDTSAMLAGTDLDGLVLASPARFHVDDARLAVAAGVPVLVEKPPAPDAAGAAELVALGGGVWLGFNRRFDDGARAVRSQVPSDGPVDVEAEIRYRRLSWRPVSTHDDALLDLGPHLVDWVRWLTGAEIVEVSGAEVSADRAVVSLVHTRGRATIRAAADQIHQERIEVRGPGGARLAEHRVGGVVAAVRGRLPWAPSEHPLAATLGRELAAFAEAARGGSGSGADRLGTPLDGLAVMSVIDAARTTAASGGQPTSVALPVEP